MAEAFMIDSRLRLSFEVGMDEKGKPIFKTKTFGNVKKTATSAEIYEVAQAIGSLSSNPLSTVVRNDSYDILG